MPCINIGFIQTPKLASLSNHIHLKGMSFKKEKLHDFLKVTNLSDNVLWIAVNAG